jgi:hypothetical protein
LAIESSLISDFFFIRNELKSLSQENGFLNIHKFMPEINSQVDFPAVLTKARRMANLERQSKDGRTLRSVAIILPNREIALQPTLASGSAAERLVQMAEKSLPSNKVCNVVGIAFNDLKGMATETLAQTIPFLGLLLGSAYIGHNVVVFEGHPSALAEGLVGADVLLADSEMVPLLQRNWVDVAFEVMRDPKVYLYQSDGRVLRVDKTRH